MGFFRKYRVTIVSALCLAFILLVGLTYESIAPGDFPTDRTVTISQGMSFSQAASLLGSDGIIKSPLLYKAFVILVSGNRRIEAGEYLFDDPESVVRVAYRTTNGIQGLPKIYVTIPEGMATPDIARLLAKDILGFDATAFLALAHPLEGYLFPDTYVFYQNTTPQQVVDAMRSTFERQTVSIAVQTRIADKPFADMLTMASIIEKEATSSADRRIIAGILWKRISIGMPLQVDPPFFYIFGKDSAQLTATDLATTSPYNLYTHLGLPPTPIDNPGLDAMEDSINPTPSNYLFYLSDNNGVMHYAATLAQHDANIKKYIE